MTENADEKFDALLRGILDDPVPDEGFCISVMAKLPARRRTMQWPMIAGLIAGIATCWLALASSPVLLAGWRDWHAGSLSSSAVTMLGAMVGMMILALGWIIAETDEQIEPSSWR